MNFMSTLSRRSLACKCPKCGKGDLYRGRYDLELLPECPHCGFDYSKNDSADGPAVFLMFILGTLLVPLAWMFELAVEPPLWVHALLWGFVALALTLGTLKPLKAYVIALQYKHRPRDWADD